MRDPNTGRFLPKANSLEDPISPDDPNNSPPLSVHQDGPGSFVVDLIDPRVRKWEHRTADVIILSAFIVGAAAILWLIL